MFIGGLKTYSLVIIMVPPLLRKGAGVFDFNCALLAFGNYKVSRKCSQNSNFFGSTLRLFLDFHYNSTIQCNFPQKKLTTRT